CAGARILLALLLPSSRPSTPDIRPLSLHDALPIWAAPGRPEVEQHRLLHRCVDDVGLEAFERGVDHGGGFGMRIGAGGARRQGSGALPGAGRARERNAMLTRAVSTTRE